MKQPIIYIDGRYIKTSSKELEAFTPGLFKKEGVFETLLAIGEQVFDVKEHLNRLYSSFKGVKISESVINRIVKVNGFKVSRVRIVAWQEKGIKHIAVMALKYKISSYKKEFKVCLIKTNRVASSRFANKKSLDYDLFANAYHKAVAQGFDEALLINNKGNIFEATRSNVFWFKQGKLYTPPLSSGCLKGIMRSKVIEYAKQFKVEFQEKNLTVEELKYAEKIFLTNSLIGICFIKFIPKTI